MTAINMAPIRRCAEGYASMENTRYVLLRGESDGSYETKGYVAYDGSRINIETYSSSLTEALAEELAARCVGGESGSILEDLRNLLNTPLLSTSEITGEKPKLDRAKAIYGAELATVRSK